MKSILLFLSLIACTYSIKMTQVTRNYRKSLPTTTYEDKYFYLTNRYYLDSNYIYICLEVILFELKYDNIKYCYTSVNPESSPESAVTDCSFIIISNYSYNSSSYIDKYYYKIPTTNSYNYSIVYYDGSDSVQDHLYVTADYYDFAPNVQMTLVYSESKTSLPTTTSENKYFYVINGNYYSVYDYIYFYLEDMSFGLSYNNIKYCLTNMDPKISPGDVVSDCSFSRIYYYAYQSYSSMDKYYYKIPFNLSYTYSIVYYEGNYSSGSLYAYTHYYELNQNFKMTEVRRESKTSLTTNISDSNYFFLSNKEYYPHSSYIYFYLEDDSFGLKYNNIRYCHTDINPETSALIALNDCSFIIISNYSYQNSSSKIKYYYNIPTNSSYIYSIIYYEGNNSSGSIYAFSDYKNLTSVDNSEGLSTGAIIGIIIGSIAFVVICIIIMYCFWLHYWRNNSESKPKDVYPNSLANPLNQTNAIPPVDNPNIPLQTFPMTD